jgi:hypothetical protein
MTVWTYSVKVTHRWGDNRPIWIFTPTTGTTSVNYMNFAPVAGDSVVFNLDTTGTYVFDSNFPPTMFNNYPSISGQPVGPTNLFTFSGVSSPGGAPTPAHPSQGFTLTLAVVATVPDSASLVSIILYAVDTMGAGAIHESPDPTADPQPNHHSPGGP